MGKRNISYETISLAVVGDFNAIQIVLEHYSGYINCQAQRFYIDENNIIHLIVDKHLKLCIEAKLVNAILKFEM